MLAFECPARCWTVFTGVPLSKRNKRDLCALKRQAVPDLRQRFHAPVPAFTLRPGILRQAPAFQADLRAPAPPVSR
jgi:hypothetical protein